MISQGIKVFGFYGRFLNTISLYYGGGVDRYRGILPVLQDREPAPAYAAYHLGGEFVGHYPPPPFRYFSISLSRIRYSCPDLPGSLMADMVPDAILRSTVRQCTPRALAASGTDRVFGIILIAPLLAHRLRNSGIGTGPVCGSLF